MNTLVKKANKITIPAQYFEELRMGHTVPRNAKTGNTLNLNVSENYVVENAETRQQILARCTQDCPCALVFIKIWNK